MPPAEYEYSILLHMLPPTALVDTVNPFFARTTYFLGLDSSSRQIFHDLHIWPKILTLPVYEINWIGTGP